MREEQRRQSRTKAKLAGSVALAEPLQYHFGSERRIPRHQRVKAQAQLMAREAQWQFK